MRRVLGWLAGLVLAMVPAMAGAEAVLTASAEEITAGCAIDFTVAGESATGWRYTMLRGGKELFVCDTPESVVSYLPQEEGRYQLQVASVPDEPPAKGKGKSAPKVTAAPLATVDFTVLPPLSLRLAPMAAELACGEPLLVDVQAEGGAAPYRCTYTVAQGDRVTLRQSSGTGWHWVPSTPGEYTLTVALTDARGACTESTTTFRVTDGPGLSARAVGGQLLAHGGQQGWIIYAPADWEASTGADFIALDRRSGRSGQVLTVTATGETDTLRKGEILITCGGKSLRLPVYQSAGHGVDEEIRLGGASAGPQVDGTRHALWTDASASRTFTVQSDEDWTASADADFIRVETAGDALTLTLDDPDFGTLRSGTVTVHSPAGDAYIHLYQPPAESLHAAEALPLPEEEAGITLHSQQSGLWKNVRYDTSTLEHSGCAIFALSHALQQLGYTGEAITPAVLAKTYAFALLEGGTMNSTLVGHASEDFGFRTRYELYENIGTIRSKMAEGAVFSFSVASGHIAMIAEMNEDGTMFRVIDSAPSATWERIRNARLYRQEADGSFVAVESLNELEGARFYIETGGYGALTYWLEDDYVARRGVRLIQPRADDPD